MALYYDLPVYKDTYKLSPKTDIERVVCLAYYLTHYRNTPHYKTLDLSNLITINAIPSGTPIVVASGSPIIQASTSVGAFPMFQTAESWANGASFAGLVPILFNPGMVVRELTGGTFVLCSDAAYAIIGSAFSLRVYGLYRIKSGLPF